VRDRLKEKFVDLGETQLKNIVRPVRVYALRLWWRRARRPARKREPPRLSLVVLPFANIGGDPEQEYFVDDVTERLTTDLSRISGADCRVFDGRFWRTAPTAPTARASAAPIGPAYTVASGSRDLMRPHQIALRYERVI
jgi:hypothetical protein